MQKSLGNGPSHGNAGRRGNARVLSLVLGFFLVGVAISTFWFLQNTKKLPTQRQVELSPATTSLLQRLAAPVELRYYWLLDPATVDPATQTLAAEADRLLSEYDRAGAGKVTVKRLTSENTITNATADGIRPFNIEKGKACFLGIVVASGGAKEALPQLSPEWQSALEADLTRAIARVEDARTAKTPQATPADPAVLEEVRSTLPDVDSMPAQEAEKSLRAAAVDEFTKAAAEMQTALKQAQEQLKQAQASGSAAEQQAAVKHLQEVQASQTELMKEIAAKSQARLRALQAIKKESK